MPDVATPSSTTPPAAFDLRWSDMGARSTSNGPRHLFEARSTAAFDAAWTGSRRGQLREMGYGTKRGDSGWMAQYWAKPSAAEEAARAAATAQAVQASRATDADLVIPAPEGRTYLPYQRAGIAYAMARAATLIGDEMGLGKTIQAIGVLNAGHARRVLIASPASLKLNWRRELTAWMVEPLPVHVIDGGKATFPDVSGGGVVVINYDVMHNYEAQLRAVSWDLLVCDEAHLLKSKSARRTRAVFGGAATKKAAAVAPIAARRRLLLTGTPMSNRPSELHPLLAFLDRSTWGDFFPFARRYCNAYQTRFGWDFDGSSHLDELQERLRASVMVRRLKADVLTELPAKVRQVVPLEAGTAALRRLLADEQAAHEAWEALASAGAASRAAAFAELSRAREAVGLAKAPLVAEHVLRDEGPVVVFAHHKSVIAALVAALGEAGRTVVTVTGDMAGPERQASVDAFQGGTADVIMGTLGAMGVGHTLARSAHVIMRGAGLGAGRAVAGRGPLPPHRSGWVRPRGAPGVRGLARRPARRGRRRESRPSSTPPSTPCWCPQFRARPKLPQPSWSRTPPPRRPKTTTWLPCARSRRRRSCPASPIGSFGRRRPKPRRLGSQPSTRPCASA